MKTLLLLSLAMLNAEISTDPGVRWISWREYRIAETQHQLLKDRNRLVLLNYLIAKYGYRKYLEIGVADGVNFAQVSAGHKTGVDPFPDCHCEFPMTSDEFFRCNKRTFDLIFIDGLHHYEQVLRDVQNSLKCLNPGGRIVLHDCLPMTCEDQTRFPVNGPWTGDVWKAAAYIRMHWKDIHLCVLDMDYGCGIITPNKGQDLYPATPIQQMDWDFYIKNRDPLLNVVTVEDWLKTED